MATILTFPTSSNNDLEQRLKLVRQNISDACSLVGRSDQEITLIVVTKFHPVSLVQQLIDLGVRDVGESRHQEAEPKAAELADQNLTWHFVGQVQTKKARRIRQYASVIHSVDRQALVDALGSDDDLASLSVTEIFIQINLTDDPARGGVSEPDLEPLVEHALGMPGVRVRGVMAVAPREGDPAHAFARLRAASERVQTLDPTASAISAGMSGDYRQAIAFGATHLRIGSAITAKSPDQ